MSMLTLMVFAVAALGVLMGVVIFRRSSGGRESASSFTGAVIAALAIGVALAGELLVLGSGSWPFMSMGASTGLEMVSWLFGIPGEWQFVAPLILGFVGLTPLLAPDARGVRSGGATVARRTILSFVPRGWAVLCGVLALVAVGLTLVGGGMSSPDEDGRFTMWAQDVGMSEVGTLVYGWAYSWPSLIALGVLVGASAIALAIIAHPPLDAEEQEDQARRRSRSRAVAATASGGLFFHIGAVLIFFAYTASLKAGVFVDDDVVPVFPPFAAAAPFFLILGVAAIVSGFAVWTTLLLAHARDVTRAHQRVAARAH
ncbi:hypothetical protein RZO50_02050 [Microbacterium sp. SSW1-59]|uniref:hypothetical protein n=1 Tax=Microbacterium xanthum TaxID=3079794 RepID=UPI002AD3B068|nr:hypothetical protein [Microbacterium sp. SSW1-59]MDZ8200279.1 hypothetical protein [Microbacterium sp. SSW1-59]